MPDTLPGDIKYAGFWLRFGAFLIDSLLVSVVLVIILLAIFGMSYVELHEKGETLWADIVFQGLLPAIAAILFWRYRGATPGKMLLSAKIVDADTLGRPSTGALVGRYLAYLVSMFPMCLGFLWIAFDKRKQGWHDKLAGTVVVRTPD